MQGIQKLFLYSEKFAVCKLDQNHEIPDWAIQENQPFYSITKTEHELSITCLEKNVPSGVTSEGGWRALALEGPLAFSQTGILVSVIGPLANGNISIFAISTFDTDFILLKADVLEQAITILQERFIIVERE
ncbi:MAG: ACT domain-containing protein [Saprospiraceae bacterium]|nr:ACT domain-containing protein [Saprospiraceae bacterium]